MRELIIIAPLDEFVQEDVHYFKTDTQGWDLSVLKGATRLFHEHFVRMVSTELWPKGLHGAGADTEKMLRYLVEDLGFVCFDSRLSVDGGTKPFHAETLEGYVALVEGKYQETQAQTWGFFDDLLCICDYHCAARKNPQDAPNRE